jgi:hypothetical protein
VKGAGLDDPVAVRVRDEDTVNETSVNVSRVRWEHPDEIELLLGAIHHQHMAVRASAESGTRVRTAQGAQISRSRAVLFCAGDPLGGGRPQRAIGVRFGLDGHRLVTIGIDGGERNRSPIRYALDRDGRAAREGWVPHDRALGLGARSLRD